MRLESHALNKTVAGCCSKVFSGLCGLRPLAATEAQTIRASFGPVAPTCCSVRSLRYITAHLTLVVHEEPKYLV